MSYENRVRDAVRRSRAGPAVRAPQLLDAPRALPGAGEARADAGTHSISLNSAYGSVLACEEVAASAFPDALRRFYNHAMEHANAVVVLDGITHTRNAFLEFVREFRQCEARSARDELH